MTKHWAFLIALAVAAAGVWTWKAGAWQSKSGTSRSAADEPSCRPQAIREEKTPLPAIIESKVAAKLDEGRFAVRGGTARFVFDQEVLDALFLGLVARGAEEETADGRRVSFGIEATSTLEVQTDGVGWHGIRAGEVRTSGAFLLVKSGDRVVIGNLAIRQDDDGAFKVVSTLAIDRDEFVVFDMGSVMIDFVPSTLDLRMAGSLSVSEPWAEESGIPQASGVEIGTIMIEAQVMPVQSYSAASDPQAPGACDRPRSDAMGPDVIVADLQSVKYYGRVEDIHAYAIGTHACNLGDERAKWIARTNQHPVIVQNMYRLKDDRYEQIGMSWVKHGFYAVSWSLCGPCDDPTDGSELGVGCSDPYSASLNGVQSNMSRRSDVNAHTGQFPYPWSAPEPHPVIGKRLQVHEIDLDPNQNVDAQYFVQGHYVTAGDAAAGTSDNNASYRSVSISVAGPHEYEITPTWITQRQQPGIRAWQDTDPSVVETDLRVPDEGLFILAAKAIDLETGLWRYSYALQNLNSDRSARSFSVPLPDGAVVSNVGFHDVDYHSGEIYDLTDWPAILEDDAITWETESYDVNPSANALRFSTLYNFYFDTNVEPDGTTITIELFKPGEPPALSASSIGPKLDVIDCNDNGVADECDIDCEAEGCAWPCGGSIDCNSNGLPDECEPDCNGSGQPDDCDTLDGTSLDCNDNLVPDECEPDCNDNGIADECDVINCDGAPWCTDCNQNGVPDGCDVDCDGNGFPDDCVAPPDTDQDGVNNCYDLCPLTTPAGRCRCPANGECCWPNLNFCLPGYPYDQCLVDHGVPDCAPGELCRQGCLYGDFDADGDLDLCDYRALQIGFSGGREKPEWAVPDQEYWLVFDVDDDTDIDLADFERLYGQLTGP